MRRLLLLFALALPALAQNPETAAFPSAVTSDSELLCWGNNGQTTLNGSINDTTLTVVVDDAANLCAPGMVTIGSEIMSVCSIATNTLTICSGGRGFDGSTAASHTDGATVSSYVSAYWLNQIAAEIKAIQTKLTANLASTTYGAGATITHTFDASAGTDCTATYGNNTIDFACGAVGFGNGTGVIGLTEGSAPGALTNVCDAAGEHCLYVSSSTGLLSTQENGGSAADYASLTGTQTLTNKTIDGESNTIQHRRAATDCTAETGGKNGELCLEDDDNTIYRCEPSAGDCDTAGEWIQYGSSGGAISYPWAGVDIDTIYMSDEFGCTDQGDGDIGALGWDVYTGILTTSCNTSSTPSIFSVKTGAADSLRGIVAFRTASGATTTPVVGDIESDTLFEAYARFTTLDTAEVVYKIGFMNDAATETVDHDASTVAQDFIGVYWKDESTDSASECAGVSTAAGGYTDNTGWQFYSSDNSTTSGLVDSTEAVSSANMTWVRWRYTATPSVEVCIDVAAGTPTFANCNEFSTLTQVSADGMGFGFLVSTCDGSNAGNNGRLDVDFWALRHARY